MSVTPFRRASSFLTRFARGTKGTTATEFALISIPMLMLIFGVLELAMVLLVYTTMETATEHAARQIRTGEFQTGGSATKGDFKNLVCGGMSWLSTQCSTNLTVDVQTFSTFASLASNAPASPTAFNPATTCFTAGNPGDIVLVRVYYTWTLFTPLLDVAMQNMGTGSGKRLLSTVTAFRNEPYSEAAPLGARC